MGVTNSGFNLSKISGGITSSVSRVPAIGATVFTFTPYFSPSSFSVFMSPTSPIFAAP